MFANRNVRLTFWLKLLAFAFLFLSMAGWLRFEQALRDWSLLIEFGAQPGPLYIVLTGALWGFAGLVPMAGILTHRPWAAPLARAAAIFFVFTYWVDKLWITQSPSRLDNWPFALVTTVIWLLFANMALSIHPSPPDQKKGRGVPDE